MIHCVNSPPPSQAVPITVGRTLEQASQKNRRFRGTLDSVPRTIPMLRNLVQNALTFRILYEISGFGSFWEGGTYTLD